MPIKCLIVDELHESIGPLLAGIGVAYDYRPDITREEIKTVLPGYDGLVIRSKTRVDEDLLTTSKLKFVARAGAGIDNLDEKALQQRNIRILNAPEGNRDAVGEHTVGLILNLLHNLTRGHNQIMAGTWEREGNRGRELGSLTVGIYGYGNTGAALAKKLAGFGCRVIAYDILAKQSNSYVEVVDLAAIYEETDVLSLHIPLTAETKALADTSFFQRFAKPLVFINTSRGEIAPLAAIKEALHTGNIYLAGLDVLECEKFSRMNAQQAADLAWLQESGRVLFTPHVAGWTFESYARINAVLADKIAAFLEQGG